MFTGIIEEKGKILSLDMNGSSGSLAISASVVLEDVHIGDSIAVNGICLTVTSFTKNQFTADVMAETVRRTSLAGKGAGDSVNLERAMAAGGRFGGHIVSGHIDGTGNVLSMEREENAVWIRIGAAPEILRYIVEKGSICIDGISLTVAKVDDISFSVSIIPHTGSETTLLDRRPGDLVNLETDIIAKYVEKLTKPFAGSSDSASGGSGITMEFLEEYGF